jgi:energy-converting hydrogenase A subunit M
MSRWIYEQDLVSQKYRILIAMRHDRIIRQIAADLGIGLQDLRKYFIEHLDMILLENLPARYEAALAAADDGDPVARAVGRALYTTYIPLVPPHVMDSIYRRVDAQVKSGTPLIEAAAKGRAMIREAMEP